MKLLCGSDFHGKMPEGAKDVVDSEKPAALLYAGDMAPHGWDDGSLEELAEALTSLDIPVYAVEGNIDDPKFLKLLDSANESFHFLSMSKAEIGGYTIVGLPDSFGPATMGISVILSSVYKEALRGCDPTKTIILAHVPPKNTKADLATEWGYDEHAGDEGLRAVIDEFQPLLVICGHIEEARGLDKAGKTIILNTARTLSVIELKEGKKPKIRFLE